MKCKLCVITWREKSQTETIKKTTKKKIFCCFPLHLPNILQSHGPLNTHVNAYLLCEFTSMWFV